jgi:predicted DNA binding protein
MALTELTFRLQHDCPFNDFTRKHPDVPFAVWCNGSTDFMEVDCPDAASYERIQPDLLAMAKSRGSKMLNRTFEGGNLQVLVRTCTCNKGKRVSVSDHFEKHNMLEIQPTVYHDGWEHYRIIAFSDTDIKNLFRGLEGYANTEILSRKRIEGSTMRDAFLVSLNTLFNELTQKQADALLNALESGYYQVPKKVTTEEIARRFKVPRTTYEEHIRKAESKVLRAVAPYVSLYARSRLGNHARLAQRQSAIA